MEEILKIQHIQKAFGPLIVHRDVNFSLIRGEMVGLLGGSGTGKSVLLRSLIGLEHIDHGKIVFHQKEIQDLEEEELYKIRTQISYSFQSGALFDSETVFENIAFPLFEHTQLSDTEIEKKVADVLGLIGMKGKELLMPADLSGGIQKRVGMARSMILEPDIILYDEPTAGLDPTNTQNVLNIMQALKERGIAGIFVTHDIPAALKVCDRILILKDGVIVYEGTPQEMVNTDNPLVKEFFINERKNQPKDNR